MFRYVKTVVIIGIVLVLVLLGVSGVAYLQDVEHPRNEKAEWDVMSELNRWRVRRGLYPLVRNSQLDELALIQAEYIVQFAPFSGVRQENASDFFHTDVFGGRILERAEIFDWPFYETPERMLIAEIAAYYPGTDGAIDFWSHSPPHSAAVQTAGFREIGVAVVEHRGWHLSFAVLGGRQDVLPVSYDPRRNRLYLTTDESFFSDNFQPTRLQLFDSAGNRIHADEYLVWSDKLTLPPNATNELTVVVTDGIQEITTRVNLYESRVFPSEPTPMPTNTPMPTMTPTPVTSTPTPIPPTATSVPTVAPVGDTYQVRLTYDSNAITLINQSGKPLNLLPMVVRADRVDFQRTATWWGRYSEVPVSEFPPNYCLQAWSFEVFYGPPDLPDDCMLRASGRSILSAGQRFWLAGQFEIRYRNEVIATCTSQAGECSFDLPE